MPLFDFIDKLIREHGSSSILKDHLQLIREQAQKEIADLKREHADEIRNLKTKHAEEVAALNRQLSAPQQAERCEFCRKPSAEVVEITPHENSQFAMMGIKIYHYRCSSCEKTFTKQKNSLTR